MNQPAKCPRCQQTFDISDPEETGHHIRGDCPVEGLGDRPPSRKCIAIVTINGETDVCGKDVTTEGAMCCDPCIRRFHSEEGSPEGWPPRDALE